MKLSREMLRRIILNEIRNLQEGKRITDMSIAKQNPLFVNAISKFSEAITASSKNSS